MNSADGDTAAQRRRKCSVRFVVFFIPSSSLAAYG
jgi:hypothetical protein